MAATQNALHRVLGFRNAPPSVLLSIYKSNLQQRAFSATSAAKRAVGPVPKFEPTTNPKLDAILAKLREDDIIPAYLPQNYYRLVYRPKNRDRLTHNPITIQIEGEPYTLKPKLKQPGAPGKLFTEALDLMKEPADFAVLPELIRGYSVTKPIAFLALNRIARRVIKFGKTDVLMEIARTAEHSGFRFNKDIARDFMFELRLLEQQPDRASVVKAVKYAKELLTIIGKRELYINSKSTTRYSDDPVILGTALSIYADASLRSHEVWHEDAAEKLVLQLKDVWENIEWNPAFREYNGGSLRALNVDYHRVAHDIKALTVVLEGMLQAKKVLGPEPESLPLLEAEGEVGVFGEPGPELKPESSPLLEAEGKEEVFGEPGPEPEPESSPLLEEEGEEKVFGGAGPEQEPGLSPLLGAEGEEEVFGEPGPEPEPESSPLLEEEGEEKVFGGAGPEQEPGLSPLLGAEGEEEVFGEPGPEPEPGPSPLLGAERKGLEAEGGRRAGPGGLPPKKPKRVRPTDPALLSWLETESERLATLITRLQEFIVKTEPLVSRKAVVGVGEGVEQENEAEAEQEVRDGEGKGEEENGLIKL